MSTGVSALAKSRIGGPDALRKQLLAFLAAACLTATAWGHGGEDHGDAAAPLPSGQAAPRAVAQSEDFEVVAVLAQGRLTLYLDRYVDNAPVADAQIEVESGSFQAAADQVAPGVYVIAGETFARPGRYPLTLAIQAGTTSDLLTATLDLSAPAAGVEHAHGWGEWAVWGAAGGLLLLAGGLIAVRRRQRKH